MQEIHKKLEIYKNIFWNELDVDLKPIPFVKFSITLLKLKTLSPNVHTSKTSRKG